MIDPTARGAWRTLESRLRPFIARRVRSESDVDDVLQDVFLRMHRGLSSLRAAERFGPWVYQLARNAIVDYQRAAAKHKTVGDEALLSHAADVEVDDAGARGLTQSLAAFVVRLPSPYREAITLVELEGMTHVEAAAMLGISVSGLKSRVQRGRRYLRRALEACCQIALDVRQRVIGCEPRSGQACACASVT